MRGLINGQTQSATPRLPAQTLISYQFVTYISSPFENVRGPIVNYESYDLLTYCGKSFTWFCAFVWLL